MILCWLLTVASLAGVWLNIRKHVACFWIWSVTNAGWCAVDVVHGVVPQAVVQLVYLALSIHGIRSWSRPRAAGGQP